MKTALIIVYYGKIPSFLSLFLGSCKYNQDIDFYFFTDWDTSTLPILDNVKFIPSSFNHFNELSRIKLKIDDLKIEYGYKLCDLKPAWTHIFEDFVMDYDFVGYCDIDLIFGDISRFFNDEVAKRADLFTITQEYISGALTIFRNNKEMRTLYRKASGWEFIFRDSRHWAFDEELRIDESKTEDVKKYSLESFSDCVFNLKNGIAIENDHYIGYESRPGLVRFNDGHIFGESGEEFVFFHYVGAKQCPFWTLPDWKELPIQFYVNKYGFYIDKKNPLRALDLLNNSHLRRQVIESCEKKGKTVRKLLRNIDIKTIFATLKKYMR